MSLAEEWGPDVLRVDQSTAERMTLQQRQNLVTVAHRNGCSQATVEFSIRKAFVLFDGLCIAEGEEETVWGLFSECPLYHSRTLQGL